MRFSGLMLAAALAGCAGRGSPESFRALAPRVLAPRVLAPLSAPVPWQDRSLRMDEVAAPGPSIDQSRLAGTLQASNYSSVRPLRRPHHLTVAGLAYLPADKQFDMGLGGSIKYAFREWDHFEINGEFSVFSVEGDVKRGASGEIQLFPIFLGARYIQDIPPDLTSIFMGFGIGPVWVRDRNVSVLFGGAFTPVTIDHTLGGYVSMGVRHLPVVPKAIFEFEYRFMFAESEVLEIPGTDAELSGHMLRINVGYIF